MTEEKREVRLQDVEEDEIDLYELWLVMKKRKKVILGTFLIITVLTAIVSFLLTPVYRSTASVIPVSNTQSPLGNLAGLAALAGLSIGQTDESQKVIAVLKSRTIKENIIKKLNLINVLLEEIPEDREPLNVAIEELDDITSIDQDKKTGVIHISVDFKDPILAAKIANAYVDELQKILNEKALTVAKMNRIFLEKRLKEEEEKLKKYQIEMAKFQKKTRLIEPKQQLKGTMELYAQLLIRKITLQIRLRELQSALSENNPKIEMIKEQLKAIDTQLNKLENKGKESAFPSITDVPEKLTEYVDLLRKLKTSEAIYETLLKAYEQAKFEEAKENLYVQVIDEAFVPDIPEKPKKKLMVAVAAVSSLFLGIFLAFFLEWIENIKKRHQEIETAS